MKTFAIASLLVLTPIISFANCVGTDTYYTCTDTESGNNYTVTKFGNTTNVQGNNYRTGSSWNQNSQKLGNTTYTNGTNSSGQTWSAEQNPYGSTYRDSKGKTTNCDTYGNCY